MIQVRTTGVITSFVLDAVRFLSSQGVLLGHLWYFSKIDVGPLNGLASYCLLLFFILSGYLISTSLFGNIQKSQDYSFASYFKDRFFRIYPPFVASLVFVFILDLVGFLLTSQPFSITQYLFNFAINLLQLQEFPLATYINEKYMIEFFRFHYLGTNLPLWTIGIEWWLYMFFGVVVFQISGRMKFRVYHWPILAFLLITPFYFMLKAVFMERGLTLYWFLGSLLTIIAGRTKLNFRFRYVHFVGLLLVITGLTGFVVLGFLKSALLFGAGLVVLVSAEHAQPLTFDERIKRTGKFLAGYSYSLYLIHYPILYFSFHVFQPETKISTLILLYLIINIIAMIFARLFEHPSPKLKKAYENYRSGNH